MFINVIPFHHSFGLDALTYHVPEAQRKDVHIGSLVYIPWRESEDIALVVEMLCEAPDIDTIKSTIRPDCSIPLLHPSELQLLGQMIHRYILPLHKALQFLIPLPILSRYEKQSYLDVQEPVGNKIPPKPGSLIYEHVSREKDIIETCREISQKESTVIILPHAFMLERYAREIGGESLLDDPRSTATKQFKTYNQILKHQSPIVIGTRKTLLKRIGAYDHIIYVHDTLSPTLSFYRYQIEAYWVARKLHEMGKNLSVYTNTPSISHMYEHLTQTHKTL